MKIEDACRILKACFMTVRWDVDYKTRYSTGHHDCSPGGIHRIYHLMVWLEHFLRSDDEIIKYQQHFPHASLWYTRASLKSRISKFDAERTQRCYSQRLEHHFKTLDEMLHKSNINSQFYIMINKTRFESHEFFGTRKSR